MSGLAVAGFLANQFDSMLVEIQNRNLAAIAGPFTRMASLGIIRDIFFIFSTNGSPITFMRGWTCRGCWQSIASREFISVTNISISPSSLISTSFHWPTSCAAWLICTQQAGKITRDCVFSGDGP